MRVAFPPLYKPTRAAQHARGCGTLGEESTNKIAVLQAIIF
jgi:hypothetical protein